MDRYGILIAVAAMLAVLSIGAHVVAAAQLPTTSYSITQGESVTLTYPAVAGCSATCAYSWVLSGAPQGVTTYDSGTFLANKCYNPQNAQQCGGAGILSTSTSYQVSTTTQTTPGSYVYTMYVYNPSNANLVDFAFTVAVAYTPQPLSVTTTPSGTVGGSSSPIAISATVSGGSGSYAYQWYSSISGSSSCSSGSQISGAQSYIYSATTHLRPVYYCVSVSDSQTGSTGSSSWVEVTGVSQPAGQTSTTSTTTVLYNLPSLQTETIACNSGILGTITGISTCGCGLLPSLTATQIKSNEPWYCPINEQVYNQWSQWIPLVIVASLIAFLVSAVIFMAGVALGSAKIRNFGQSEFYEAIATALVAVGFVYVSSVMFGVIPGTLVGAINPYATSFNLIASTINSAQNMYASIYNVYIPLSYSSSLNIKFGGLGSGLLASIANLVGALSQTFSNAYAPAVKILFLTPANALAGFLVDGMAILYGEYYLLLFFSVAAVPVFLLPGVILRAFVPTRAMGGAMIAIGIGFFFVMPSLFATAFYFTAPGVMRDMATANANFAYLANQPSSISDISPTAPLVTDLQYAQSSLSGFWFMILFYPALTIAITYAFVQQLAQLIGGSYRASSRIRSWL